MSPDTPFDAHRRELEQQGKRLLRVTSGADILPRPVHWLWRHRIPLGTLTLIEGSPGVGKTSVVLDIIARITRGGSYPDGAPCSRADVHIVGPEDSASRVIRPRLDAAGADHRGWALVDPGPDAPPLQLPRDVPLLGDALALSRGAKSLLYIDALHDLLAGVKINDDAEVRTALRPVVALAETYGVAVLATRHLSKGGNRNAAMAGLGSVGFAAVARSILHVYRDSRDPSLLLLTHAKSNLGPLAPTLRYRLVAGADDVPPRVEWDGVDRRSAEDLQGEYRGDEPSRGSESGALDEATAWLREALTEPRPRPELVRAAKDDGISERTLKRAYQALGVQTIRAGFGAPAVWRMPTGPQSGPVLFVGPNDDFGPNVVHAPQSGQNHQLGQDIYKAPVGPNGPDEEWEERAAIMEYDGGMTREEAERAASYTVAKSREASRAHNA